MRKAVAGEGELIPIVYGRARVPALIPTAVDHKPSAYVHNLYLLCVWCQGEIDAVESVLVGGQEFTGNANHYLGKQTQAVDPFLAAAIPGYADTLPGVAYSVLEFTKGSEISQQIMAQVRGT